MHQIRPHLAAGESAPDREFGGVMRFARSVAAVGRLR